MVTPSSAVPAPEQPLGADELATYVELYKTAVEMADRTSARRAGANTFFVTLNTGVTAVVGIVSAARKPPPHGTLPAFDAFGLVFTALAGVILAAVWWALLRYYRRLSRAKWHVINRLETRLPTSPFTDEWKLLHPADALHAPDLQLGDEARLKPKWWHVRKRLSRTRRQIKHREATVVEQAVPFVFMAIYVALAVRVLLQ